VGFREAATGKGTTKGSNASRRERNWVRNGRAGRWSGSSAVAQDDKKRR
jgi:hypothetical protein